MEQVAIEDHLLLRLRGTALLAALRSFVDDAAVSGEVDGGRSGADTAVRLRATSRAVHSETTSSNEHKLHS